MIMFFIGFKAIIRNCDGFKEIKFINMKRPIELFMVKVCHVL